MKIVFSQSRYGKDGMELRASTQINKTIYTISHVVLKVILKSFRNKELKKEFWEKLKIKLSHDLSYFIVYSTTSSSSRR
jgi:hypothetical protein